MRTTRGLTIAAAACALFMAGGAQAALVSCPAAFTTDGTAKVNHPGASLDTAASACQYIVPSDPSTIADTTNVNLAGFFGTTTWTVNTAKLDLPDGPGQLAGTWALTGANFAAYDYMIVFKDGADTNLIGFLLNEETANGDWLTPFTEPPFDFSGGSLTHGVSHFTIFQRTDGGGGGGGGAPEPASLALVGLALCGLGLAQRRRRG